MKPTKISMLITVVCAPILVVVLPVAAAGADDGARPRPRPPAPQDRPGSAALGAPRGEVTLGGPFTYWNWPDGPTYTSFSERITIESATTSGAPFFWSYQFTTPIDQGYIGLQDDSSPNHTKIALFSMWMADGAQGANCGTFDGEGSGYTCRIDPFNWVPDREYIVRVALAQTDATGQWYRGSVQDTVTGTSREIGRIHLPAGGAGTFRGWVSWTEYFGARPSTCQDMPRARVKYRYPTANAGAVRITSHQNDVDPGECRAKIDDITGGVRQSYPK